MEQKEVTKKKRIRPTWTQVHELEQTIKEQQELIENVCGENIALTAENNRLRNRGFLDRILNK